MSTFKKKGGSYLGGRRERMINPADRKQAVILVNEAHTTGARKTRIQSPTNFSTCICSWISTAGKQLAGKC